MAWSLELTDTARRSLKKLDPATASRILRFLVEKLAQYENPRTLGKPLTGELGDYWRYRVGNYRVVVEIRDDRLEILVIRIGHRREVYRRAK
jgi:mRNA interferase RelE/StbE